MKYTLPLCVVALTVAVTEPQFADAANGVPRIGIISDAGARSTADLLLIELQKAKCEMVERDEIGKILKEQAFQARMNRAETLRIGRLLKADGLVLISSGTNRTLSVRLVAVAPGVVVWYADAAADKRWVPTVADSLVSYFPKLSVKAGEAVPVSLLRVRPAFGMARAIQLADDLTRLLLLRLVREPSLFVLERENLARAEEESHWSGQDSEFWAGSFVLEGRASFDLVQTNRVTLVLAVRPPPGGAKVAPGGTELVENGDTAELAAMVERLTVRLRQEVGTTNNAPAWDTQAEALRLMALVESLEDPEQQKAVMATVMALGRRDLKAAGAYRNAVRTAAYRDPARFTDLSLRLAVAPGLEKQGQDFLELLRFHNSYQPSGGFSAKEKRDWVFCYFQPVTDIERFLSAVVQAKREKELGELLPEIQAELRQTAANMLALAPYETSSLVAVQTARYQHGTTREILDMFRRRLFPPKSDPVFEKMGSLGGAWFLNRQLTEPVFPDRNAESPAERDRLWQDFTRELESSDRLEMRFNLAIHRLQQEAVPSERVKRRRVLQKLLLDNTRVFRFGDGSGASGSAFPGFRYANGNYSVISRNNYDFDPAKVEDIKEDARQALHLFLLILKSGRLGEGDAGGLLIPYLSVLSEDEARTAYDAMRRYMPSSTLAPRIDMLKIMETVTARFPSVMDDVHRAELAWREEDKLAPKNALVVSDIIPLPAFTNKFGRNLPWILGTLWVNDRFRFCWGNEFFSLDPETKSYEQAPIPREHGEMADIVHFSRVVVTDSLMLLWRTEFDAELRTTFTLHSTTGGTVRVVRLPFAVQAAAQIGRKLYILTSVRQITVYQNFGLVEMDIETLQCTTLRAPGTPMPKGKRAGKEVTFEDLDFLYYDLSTLDGMLLGSVGRTRYGWNPETGKVVPMDARIRQVRETDTNSPAVCCRRFGFDMVLDDGNIKLKAEPTLHMLIRRVGSTEPDRVPLLFNRNPNDPAQQATAERRNPAGVALWAFQTPTSLLVPCAHQRYFWKIPYTDIRRWLEANFPGDATNSVPTFDLKNATPSPGDTLAVDIGRGVKMAFCWVPPGEFTMGSPDAEAGRIEDEVQHRVAISRGFWVGKYEVTQKQWKNVMGNNPSMFNEGDPGKAPVEGVTWDDCQVFVRKLTEAVRAADRRPELTNFTLRLPTEAEWEYACRAGTKTALNNGKEMTFPAGRCRNLDEIGWYKSEFRNDPANPPRPQVGRKRPNAWGLYDMSGSVLEWCQDWYGEYTKDSVTDPQGPTSGTNRVLRGGTWFDFAGYCRSACRFEGAPDKGGCLVGLRVVLSR